MNRLIRLWNQNRKKIIITVLAVVFLIVVIQVLNQFAKKNNQKKEDISNTTSTDVPLPTKSVISEKTVSSEVTKNNVNVIDEFIKYCNNGNIQKAYDLLSDECKIALYPTVDKFKGLYYNNIFSENRIYNIQNWISYNSYNTYLVDFYNDVMATGKVENTIEYQDYITVNEKDNSKISINSFIRYDEINTVFEDDTFKIAVIGRQVYKEYEIYTMQVENKTDKTIVLDTKNKTDSLYIRDNKNVVYKAILSSLTTEDLTVYENNTTKLDIKFNKKYNGSSDKIKNIIFTDIVKDNETYEQNKASYKERMRVIIEI